MAVSLDGRVAGPGGEPVQLSGEADMRRVHRLRADSGAIAVGVGTVLNDDPRLTARPEPRPSLEAQPVRVVVDSQLRTPGDAQVLDDRADTLVLAATEGEVSGAEVHVAPGDGSVDLAAGFAHLAERGVDQLMLEGGPTLAGAALAEGLVDRAHVYIAPRILGGGPCLAEAWDGLAVELEPRSRTALGEGTLVNYGVRS
jgi:diaminohydroxyphosphoribosylaminopyrimidine deaminase/5-amino-6-(5-phosphoribosylamino)uracil reductase